LVSKVSRIEDIPFMPIEFFKTQKVVSGNRKEELIFRSSGTGGSPASLRFVSDTNQYIKAFTHAFETYGNYQDFAHFALLPSYLERGDSSLIYQVDYFIRHNHFHKGGFYLYDHEQLYNDLKINLAANIPCLLWGVSYALLDFASFLPAPLAQLHIIETGGMKGRREEMTRHELHQQLKNCFQADHISSEYGMTELYSQAYAIKDGRFQCPAWMRPLIFETNDPFKMAKKGKHGRIHIIDLANTDSCSFIATSDLGTLSDDGTFEVIGRMDNSDIRGCNLMMI
jgi:hypothetical protein